MFNIERELQKGIASIVLEQGIESSFITTSKLLREALGYRLMFISEPSPKKPVDYPLFYINSLGHLSPKQLQETALGMTHPGVDTARRIYKVVYQPALDIQQRIYQLNKEGLEQLNKINKSNEYYKPLSPIGYSILLEPLTMIEYLSLVGR